MSQEGASTSSEDCVTSVMRHKAVHVEWKIPKFLDLTYKYPLCLPSSSFLLGNAEWFILMCPDHCGNVYLGVLKRASSRVVKVNCSVSVLKADGSKFRSIRNINVIGTGVGMGTEVLSIPRSELFTAKDVVLPDGTLTVLATVYILDHTDKTISMDTGCQTASSDGLQTLSQNFHDLFLDGAQSDITFRVQDKDILAHKAVLSARSTVFYTMLKTDMVEKNEGIIKISDCDPDDFKDFLLYIYSGNLDVASLSLNNVFSLYTLADKYDIKELKIVCCECLVREISVDSFCDVVLFARLYNEAKLIETTKTFFNKNASLILPTSKWTSFMAEHFTVGNALLIQMADNYKTYFESFG